MGTDTSRTTDGCAPPGGDLVAQASKKRRADQVTLLYDQISPSLAATVIIGGLLAIILYTRNASPIPIVIWYSAMIALSCARVAMLSAFRRAHIDESNVVSWYRYLLGVVAASGLLWGATVLLPTPGDHLQLIMSLLVLAGMTSGAAVVYAASLTVMVAFCIPVAGFVLISLFGHPEFSALTGLILCYFVILLIAASRTCRVVTKSLDLQRENDQLIANLQAEQRRIGSVNQELEQRVTQRTEQLLKSNRRLREEILDKEKAQRALAYSESLYRSLYHANPSLFITLNQQGEVESINDYGLQFLGYSRDAVVGHPFSNLVHESAIIETHDHIQHCAQDNSEVRRWKSVFNLLSGAKIWVRIVARSVPDIEGNIHLHLVCEDISEAYELERQLAFQASHDPLTSLYNRREFENQLQRVMNNRRHDDANCVLCYLDLDKFKRVNDTCGHAAGDELLRRLGETLNLYIRGDDVLARLGGDEFAILMKNTTLGDAYKLVERLREAIENFTFRWESEQFQVSASFGLAEITESSNSPLSALRKADSACYNAKRSGRNQTRVHLDDVHLISSAKA